jgi:hypothetical protein
MTANVGGSRIAISGAASRGGLRAALAGAAITEALPGNTPI